jgi:fluoroquinolone resistance protein
MPVEYIEAKNFKNENYTSSPLLKGEYENCTFSNCIFSNTDLSGMSFSECEFDNCDLSTVKLVGTSLKDITFKNCKLLGLQFGQCKAFLLSFRFQSCVLNLSSFYNVKIKNTRFEDCKLHEVDFVSTDLTSALFKNCDLSKANFQSSSLEQADLRSAYNFSIDPESNRITKAKFSIQNISGLLDKYNLTIE